MLAGAPADSFGFGDSHGLRLNPGAGMGTIAKRLAFGATTSAPPIFAGFDFLYDGGALTDERVSHKSLLLFSVNVRGDFQPERV
jgi:hypothetical protein